MRFFWLEFDLSLFIFLGKKANELILETVLKRLSFLCVFNCSGSEINVLNKQQPSSSDLKVSADESICLWGKAGRRKANLPISLSALCHTEKMSEKNRAGKRKWREKKRGYFCYYLQQLQIMRDECCQGRVTMDITAFSFSLGHVRCNTLWRKWISLWW